MHHPHSAGQQPPNLRQLTLFLRDAKRIDDDWHARLSEGGEPPSDRPYARSPLVRQHDAELWRAFNRIRFHAPALLRTAHAQLLELPDDLTDPTWADTLDALGRSVAQLNFFHQEWIDHRELMEADATPGTPTFREMIAERNAEGRPQIRVWAENGHALQDLHAAAHPEPTTPRVQPTRTVWMETSPRHLAGQGDPRYITRSLRAAGWNATANIERPGITLTSPDRRHTIVVEPAPHGLKPWWHLHGATEDGAWQAEFTAHTPVEIIAALTDPLAHPAPGDPAQGVWPVLTDAGWSYERDDGLDIDIARHPYRTLRVSRWAATTERFIWTVEATFPDPGLGAEIVWRATLDDTTPQHLLHSLATALAGNAPALREMFDVPHTHLVTQEPLSAAGTTAGRELEHRLLSPLGRLYRRQARQSSPPPPPAASPVVRTI
ncbi:DUF317 domain-containing protein [Streptomyces sp. NPDC005012]|uniref:DUF317 domain-containing protein n=1 Tax=Streptomyces sp. NPDC005012 TaxID=3154558 RepID=UPI0033BD9B2D